MYRFPTVSGGIWSNPREIPWGPLTWKIQWLLRFHLQHLHLRTWSESMEKTGPSRIKTKDTTWKGHKFHSITTPQDEWKDNDSFSLGLTSCMPQPMMKWCLISWKGNLAGSNFHKCLFGARLEMKANNTKPTPCDRLKIKSQTIQTKILRKHESRSGLLHQTSPKTRVFSFVNDLVYWPMSCF